MIAAENIELRAGARVLISGATMRVQPGDRIGLVGRNGAGKTTSLKVLAGESQPADGKIDAKGEIGYLAQDPKSGDMNATASDRVLSARGLDVLLHSIADLAEKMALTDGAERDALINRYSKLEDQFAALGGYAAESEAARICSNLGLPDRVLGQQMHTLSGGQRRRVELARILFSDAETLLLDEPTNHLDADSIFWLRDYLKRHDGGLIVISHDVDLLAAVVNKVWYLDANRASLDIYNVGWKDYLKQRDVDEKRRKRERSNAEKKAGALLMQAAKMGAKATKAVAAQNMARRAEAMLNDLEPEGQSDKIARVKFPTPAPAGKTPLTAEGLSKSYGSLEIFTGVDLAVDRGARVVILGLNGAGENNPVEAAIRR